MTSTIPVQCSVSVLSYEAKRERVKAYTWAKIRLSVGGGDLLDIALDW